MTSTISNCSNEAFDHYDNDSINFYVMSRKDKMTDKTTSTKSLENVCRSLRGSHNDRQSIEFVKTILDRFLSEMGDPCYINPIWTPNYHQQNTNFVQRENKLIDNNLLDPHSMINHSIYLITSYPLQSSNDKDINKISPNVSVSEVKDITTDANVGTQHLTDVFSNKLFDAILNVQIKNITKKYIKSLQATVTNLKMNDSLDIMKDCSDKCPNRSFVRKNVEAEVIYYEERSPSYNSYKETIINIDEHSISNTLINNGFTDLNNITNNYVKKNDSKYSNAESSLNNLNMKYECENTKQFNKIPKIRDGSFIKPKFFQKPSAFFNRLFGKKKNKHQSRSSQEKHSINYSPSKKLNDTYLDVPTKTNIKRSVQLSHHSVEKKKHIFLNKSFNNACRGKYDEISIEFS